MENIGSSSIIKLAIYMKSNEKMLFIAFKKKQRLIAYEVKFDGEYVSNANQVSEKERKVNYL